MKQDKPKQDGKLKIRSGVRAGIVIGSIGGGDKISIVIGS